ncbi:MAG: HAD superfamily hydrolase (TIGR01549 family) [Thalassolituus oleivorans]|jgi:HAD superfamily hydrolase (TIGR01549 family)
MDSASRRVIEHAPLVLVDFDGTLATLRSDWVGLKKRLAALSAERNWPWDLSLGMDANLRRVRSDQGEATFTRLCDEVADAEVAGYAPQDISHNLIELLRDRSGEPTAIVTNNTKAGVLRILARPEFSGIRARVIGKEDVQASKPSPQGLLRACRLYVASPKATVFIGDSASDAEAAKAAGIGIFLRVTPPGASRLRLAA